MSRRTLDILLLPTFRNERGEKNLSSFFWWEGVSSYAISFVCCRDMMPDPEFYSRCIRESFEELRAAALALADTAPKAKARASTGAKVKPKSKPRPKARATAKPQQNTGEPVL